MQYYCKTNAKLSQSSKLLCADWYLYNKCLQMHKMTCIIHEVHKMTCVIHLRQSWTIGKFNDYKSETTCHPTLVRKVNPKMRVVDGRQIIDHMTVLVKKKANYRMLKTCKIYYKKGKNRMRQIRTLSNRNYI